jgi:hypothetical protein
MRMIGHQLFQRALPQPRTHAILNIGKINHMTG